MSQGNHQPPGLLSLASRLARIGAGALQNRLELAAIEWQEERGRLAELMVRTVALLFLGILGVLLLIATIIFLFPEDKRIYVAAAFGVLCLLGAFGAWVGLKSMLKQEPFAETVEQVKKDRVWLDSLK